MYFNIRVVENLFLQSKAYYNFSNWLKNDLSLMETVGETISLGEEILNQVLEAIRIPTTTSVQLYIEV